MQSLVQIAFYEGVHPRKGFDWILQRFGLCNAITTLSSQELPHPPEVRQYCIQALIRALYAELRDRLSAEIERHDDKPPAEASAPPDTRGVIRQLIAGRDWLFGDDCYHIDMSHLSSVAQMSMHLTPCAEMEMARELCEYGQRLTGRFVNPGDPPFEDQYRAIGLYLAILAGDNVEEGLDYFRKQAEQADPETVGTYPAQVLVNLLLRLDRARRRWRWRGSIWRRQTIGRCRVRALSNCARKSAIIARWPRWRASRAIRCISWRVCWRPVVDSSHLAFVVKHSLQHFTGGAGRLAPFCLPLFTGNGQDECDNETVLAQPEEIPHAHTLPTLP